MLKLAATPPQGLEVVGIEGIVCDTIPRSSAPQPPRGCRRDEKSPVLWGLGREAGFVTRMRGVMAWGGGIAGSGGRYLGRWASGR